MGRDTIQLDNAVSTISEEYLLEFTSKYGIPEDLHPELTGPDDTIVDFPEGKVVVAWRTGAPKDGMPPAGSYSALDVTTLNTRHTPIQKQPKLLLCLVGISRRYFLGDDVYPAFLYDDDREMDLFNLISAPNPAKVKIETRPYAAHEVPLLTATTNLVIEMDTTGASGSSRPSSTIEKSPLDFVNEDLPPLNTEAVRTEEQTQEEPSREIPLVGRAVTAEVIPKIGLEKEVANMGPLVNKRRKQMRRKRANDEAEANAPPKVLRKDHMSSPAYGDHEGKSLAAMGLDLEAVPADYVPAGHILISADRYRIC
ncbi:hypothetical protein Tco_1012527 [Tanacetum coccineum]